ncbi:copper resistance protein B [Erythrobacter sp. NE805]|uniref:copper resistance protein B n=1 Tax=Erythrobacter sp. NE805 TaxID=3389875 RepID=UPI00396AF4B4
MRRRRDPGCRGDGRPARRARADARRFPAAVGDGRAACAIGARPRHEIAREFAPYVGIAQSWRTGRSADFARLRGRDPSATSLVAGFRFWF